MKILQLTSHYYPNIGGVETHLSDLVKELSQNNQVFVLTYRPLTTKVKWLPWERTKNLTILRFPWFPGLFNKLSVYPALEFLYLLPGLFIVLPWILIISRPHVIHSHGLIAGFVGAFWGKVFGIHTVISTHSIYHFPKSGLYRALSKYIFLMTNQTLCLSNQSVSEIVSLDISTGRIHKFTYWVDLDKFKPLNKEKCKKELGWSSQFIVLFVGRLVPEKGIPELLAAANKFKPGISLKIVGSGPLQTQVEKYYSGRISQDRLPTYYSAADLVIVPSTHEEGFGRVIIEALACGTPVVAANRGAIPEAMDNTVGKLITITPQSIAMAVDDLFSHPQKLSLLAKNTRQYAVNHYSNINLNQIISVYA